MSTDYAHPALGFGTYAPISQVDARGIRVEPFTVIAGIQAGVGYDDNVALSSANKVGSLFTTVSPSVAIGLDNPLHRYYLIYRGTYGAYSSSAQDDYTDHNIALSATDSWTTRFRTSARYEYTRGHTPRGITVSSGGTSERWTQHTLDGTASYGAPGAQGMVEGDVGYTKRRYTTAGVAAAGEFDRYDVGSTFYYRVAPKTRALFRAGWAQLDHPLDPSLDNTEVQFSVGATWEALAKTTGRVGVGVVTKDFSSPTRRDFTGGSFDVGVTWTPQVQTSFDATGRRFLSETFEVGTSFLVNTVVSATWNQLWTRGIRSTVNSTYGNVEHQGAGRTDNYLSVGGRVSYPLTRSIRLGAELRHDSRSSDVGTADYSRNLFLLTAETAL